MNCLQNYLRARRKPFSNNANIGMKILDYWGENEIGFKIRERLVSNFETISNKVSR